MGLLTSVNTVSALDWAFDANSLSLETEDGLSGGTVFIEKTISCGSKDNQPTSRKRLKSSTVVDCWQTPRRQLELRIRLADIDIDIELRQRRHEA